MAEPSKERIAAALALAEADCALATAVDGEGRVPPELLQARQDAIRAYRATAPKLRTRAEVDAEIAKLTRECVENEWAGGEDGYKRWERVTALCGEETAPEPTELGACPPDCVACNPLPDPLVQQTLAADESEACSCEEAEALKAQFDRCRAIVRAARLGEVNGEAAARALERELGR
ncbi:MAG TPA: hypothetical protein VFS67_29705 [Polyangiaceae bacterium]|nr:hypothetical protein [Polyangiaceae bacterium]